MKTPAPMKLGTFYVFLLRLLLQTSPTSRVCCGFSGTSSNVEVSLLQTKFVLFLLIKKISGTQKIFSTKNGGQEFKMAGGTNQITERLVELIGRDKVHLESAVYYIDQTEETRVTVKTLKGNTFHGRYLIMATPPAVQQKIHYRPPLPAMRNQLVQRTPQGTVFKCIIYYERPFWREANMCGSLLLVGGPNDDETVPINYALDDSKPDGSKPAIVGFLPADKARKLMDKTKEERLAIIVASYAAAFDSEKALKPVHYEEQNWSAEQYSGKNLLKFLSF